VHGAHCLQSGQYATYPAWVHFVHRVVEVVEEREEVMSKLTTLRRPIAIAPGFTVRSYSTYRGYQTYEETVNFEGDMPNLTASQVNRLGKWLERWSIAKTDAESVVTA